MAVKGGTVSQNYLVIRKFIDFMSVKGGTVSQNYLVIRKFIDFMSLFRRRVIITFILRG